MFVRRKNMTGSSACVMSNLHDVWCEMYRTPYDGDEYPNYKPFVKLGVTSQLPPNNYNHHAEFDSHQSNIAKSGYGIYWHWYIKFNSGIDKETDNIMNALFEYYAHMYVVYHMTFDNGDKVPSPLSEGLHNADFVFGSDSYMSDEWKLAYAASYKSDNEFMYVKNRYNRHDPDYIDHYVWLVCEAIINVLNNSWINAISIDGELTFDLNHPGKQDNELRYNIGIQSSRATQESGTKYVMQSTNDYITGYNDNKQPVTISTYSPINTVEFDNNIGYYYPDNTNVITADIQTRYEGANNKTNKYYARVRYNPVDYSAIGFAWQTYRDKNSGPECTIGKTVITLDNDYHYIYNDRGDARFGPNTCINNLYDRMITFQ